KRFLNSHFMGSRPACCPVSNKMTTCTTGDFMPSPRFEKRSKILRKKAVIAAAGLAIVTLSCAGSQSLDKRINERWQWDGGVEASRVVERVNARTGPARLSAVVGVTGFGVRGQVLPEGKVWNFETPVDVLPSIAG